jgi:hypothetical protein
LFIRARRLHRRGAARNEAARGETEIDRDGLAVDDGEADPVGIAVGQIELLERSAVAVGGQVVVIRLNRLRRQRQQPVRRERPVAGPLLDGALQQKRVRHEHARRT